MTGSISHVREQAGPQESQPAPKLVPGQGAGAAASANGKNAAGTRSLKLSERFYARQRDLYECFADARRVQAFTQSPAKVRPVHPVSDKKRPWAAGPQSIPLKVVTARPANA